MIKKVLNIILFAAIIGATGCQKDFDIFVPDATQVTTDSLWIDNQVQLQNCNAIQLANELLLAPKTDSFTISTGGSFTFENTEIIIPANAFASFIGGTVATGKAQIVLNLLRKKGDLIRFHKPTESDGRLLETGGILRVLITKDNNPLILLPGKNITIKYLASNIKEMKVFSGLPLGNVFPAAPLAFGWAKNDSASVTSFVRQNTNDSGYSVQTNKLNWINVANYRDSNVAQKRLVVSLPRDFNNTNTSVFAVFKNLNSVLEIYPDFPNKIFRIDRIPAQRPLIIIAITKLKNDVYFIARKEIETNTTASQVVSLVPERKSLSDIKAMLDAL
jgi:hypothetical protein